MDECERHRMFEEDVKEMNDKLDEILHRLGSGDISLATLGVRMDHVEKVVFGAVGFALLAFAGAIASLVMK